MNIESVIKHFKGSRQTQAVLGVTKSTLSKWRKTGIPELRQLQIERKSGGKFRAPRDAIDRLLRQKSVAAQKK